MKLQNLIKSKKLLFMYGSAKVIDLVLVLEKSLVKHYCLFLVPITLQIATQNYFVADVS